MRASSMGFGKRFLTRAALLAEASVLCLASSASMAAIIDSGPINLVVPATIDGLYINVATGATGGTGGTTPGWDVNPYLTGGNLNIYWETTAGGVGTTAATGPLIVLGPGSTINAASLFTRAVAAASTLRPTQNAYFGFRFTNEGTGAINYGYAQFTSTGPTGFPFTITRLVFENAGAPITIAGGSVAPTFAYTPAAASTVSFTGGTTVGSTGNASIAVAVATPGSGSGATATTTTTCTAPTGAFAGFAQSVSAIGAAATTTGGPLTGTCTLGAAVATQTLTCSENRGGTATAVTFTLSCPAGTQPPLTSTPATGSTITLPAFTLGGAATTAPLQFQNPGTLAATVTCTAPAAAEFTVAPLSIPVPAGGNGSTTISFSSAVAGPFTGTLNCSAGAQNFSFNLAGTASATPLTSTPVSGSTITLPAFTLGGAATTAPVAFQNPGLVAATVSCTAPAATQFTVAPLSIPVAAGGSGSTTISFSSAVAGPFTGTLNCTAGTQTFSFNLAGTASATPLTSTPLSGATVTLPTFAIGGAPTSTAIAFQNPGAVAATVTCTAPTATQFTATPLTLPVPAGGTASVTVTFSTTVTGSFTGTLTCSSGQQTFVFNLAGGGSNAVVPVPTLGDWGRVLLALLALGLALPALLRRRV